MIFAREEYETILNYDYQNGAWNAYTNIPRDIRKFKKLGWDIIKDEGDCAFFKAPANAVTIRNLAKKRTLSAEQRAAATRRFNAYKEKKRLEDADTDACDGV